MATCSRCGNSIEFRYIGGVCIPLHLYGGCTGSGSSVVEDYAGYRISSESTCFCTGCDKCHLPVFFIRHNGGSVWVDPPLGPPWYKHGCFYPSNDARSRDSLASEYGLEESKISDENVLVGVVKSTLVVDVDSYTMVAFETGESVSISLRIKNNAGFLLGKLCIYDKGAKIIWPTDNPEYIFSVVGKREKANKFAKCPVCNVRLSHKNYDKHLKVQHGQD